MAGLVPALGALTSFTDGGALTPSSTAASNARSATGNVNVGGLTVPPLAGQGNLVIVAVVVVIGLFLFSRAG